ncbi:MAG: hypothetical protein ACR2HN_00590 [Tepidiformaceae bacterium]
MKAAVSIPNDVFAEAEELARELKTSRSGLYSRALREFLTRHRPDQVTEALDRACEAVGQEPSGFRRQAARRVFERTEW